VQRYCELWQTKPARANLVMHDPQGVEDIWLMFMVNVGKYTCGIQQMKNFERDGMIPALEVCFRCLLLNLLVDTCSQCVGRDGVSV